MRSPLFSLKQDLHHRQLLYWQQREQIAVYENDHYRWLTIGQTVQSVMARNKPSCPVLPHLHAMAMALFAAPNAKMIMELGLGGGALARLLPKTHPQARLTSVELSPTVIDCFRRFFNPEACVSQVIQADGCKQIVKTTNLELLFVDIFQSSQLPPAMEQPEFYRHCLNALNHNGVLCLNLLPQNALLVRNLKQLLLQLTGHPPWVFRVPGYRNAILVAGKKPLGTITEQAKNLKRFAQRHHLDLSLIEPVL
ncbi:spermidine synthase [Saliniradius amylolyticus]|nr:hypothetical protein [Saliniradius amylolyticus]